jgi:hypothetical protein
MRFRCLRILSVLALTVVVSTAGGLAASAPTMETTPIPTPPKPDFSSMQFMLGTWTCTNQSSRRPAPSHSTLIFSMDPTGYWIDQKTTTQKTAWFPFEAIGLDKITYDSDSQRWIDVYAGNVGDYGLSWSTGWKGNTIQWNDGYFTPSTSVDVVSESPVTGTKVSDTKITYHSTFTEKSGNTITSNVVCNKNS